MQPMDARRFFISVAGYLAGVALGSLCLTIVFLGMRSVMDVGGACADGGPYVSAQPCPEGSALALMGGIFGLFGAAGLMVWFGARLGSGYVGLVFLGWPALFISLGFNFLQYGIDPPYEQSGVEWGYLIPGVLFWLMGGIPLLVGLGGWRAVRSGGSGTAATAVSRVQARIAASPRIEFAPNSFGAPRAPAPDSTDIDEELVSQLERLSALHATGALSEEEFAAAKARILANERLDA